MAPNNGNPAIDPRSGFCRSNSIFYSKRKPTPHPPNHSLDFTTFISSRAHHGKVAFVDASTGRQLTFANLWRAVDSVATFLSDNGVRKGHVILILSPNSVFVPAVCLAAMSLGAVITTANPLNTAGEIVKQIADSKPVLAFTTRQLVPKLSESPNLIRIVLLDEQSKPAVESPRIVATLEEMLKKQPSGTCRVTDRVNQDDTAALLYSSGTTGASKGVETSHKNFIAVAQILIGRFGLDEGEHRFLCVAPMFHIYGLVYALALPASGTTAVILSKYGMHDMLSAIEKYRITNTSLVPPVLVALMKGADEIRSRYDLSSLRTVSCGGAPMSKEVIEKVVERYPTVAILQAYGLTESTAVGATTNSLEESRRYGTVGLLSPNMEAKIVESKTGEALSTNRTGEIWLRGPHIMKGYFLNAEATALTLDPEGWLKTGDLCYIDDDGFIFLVDRLKELIKYKGYQVPPAELEALLLTHPEIFDVAVIPFPDKEVGQYPMAYVVRKAGSNLSEGAVMDFVAGQVAPYKKIRRVAFIASIPKNQSGKILRKDLVQLATSKL